MSDFFTLLTSAASFAVSAMSLLFTVAAYRHITERANETFADIGADEGNHEARLERLETHIGLKVIPSPSQLDVLAEESGEALYDEVSHSTFANEFAAGEEDAELRADEDSATNEGMAHHGD